MLNKRAYPGRLGLAGLVLASLACQTVTLLPERLGLRTVPTPAVVAPAPTAAPPEATLPPAVAPPSAAGPVVGTPSETQAAVTDQVDGLEEAAAETYPPEELDRSGARATYTIRVEAAETRLLWGFGWCASDPATLADNLENMRIEFILEGQAVDLAQFDTLEGINANDQACRLYRAVVYNWPAGTTTLETRITFVNDVNDGISDYPAGDMILTYQVSAP